MNPHGKKTQQFCGSGNPNEENKRKTASIQDVQEVSNNRELQQICQSSKPSEMGIKKGYETEGDQDVKVNLKAFYSYIADQTKPKEAVASLHKENSDLTENDKEKAEELNKFLHLFSHKNLRGAHRHSNVETNRR